MFVPQNPLVKNLFVKTVQTVVSEIVVINAQVLAAKNSSVKVVALFVSATVTQKNVPSI